MGHSRTLTQDTAGDGFPADPIDGPTRLTRNEHRSRRVARRAAARRIPAPAPHRDVAWGRLRSGLWPLLTGPRRRMRSRRAAIGASRSEAVG